MSGTVTPISVGRSEWYKFRTVRSSIYGVSVTILLTVGLGALIATAVRAHWHEMNAINQAAFDPVSAALGGTMFAQFAVGVIGVVFITSEYASGSIRTTLTAVPQRGLVIAAKLAVVFATALAIGEVACLATFQIGQSIFSGVAPTASLADGAVLRSVLLAGVYLALMGALGFGLGLIFRQSASSISVFASLLLILPIIVIFLPQSWQNVATKYEPSALGSSMMSPVARAGDFSAWPALALLVVYVAAVVAVGAVLFMRRDA